MTLALSCALALALLAQEPVSLIAEADAVYARRAEGARLDQAIAFYRRALQEAPLSGEATYKLLRALHYRGAFADASDETKKAMFDEGARLGQAFVDRAEAAARGKTPGERLALLRRLERADEVYFWTAACWGQWALVRGKFAAARQGVASKVRDLAQTVVDLDPTLEEAGGYRILGRLHDQSPKILFVTGWVSKAKAIEYLEKARALAPQNSVTRFFLAEAILAHAPERKEEARGLLKSCAGDPPRPEYLVEDRYYAGLARARLLALQ